MFGFLRKRNWPIALDLGGDSIRMLQMRRTGSAVRVIACGRWRYPESGRDDPRQRRSMTVSAVREMLHAGGFRGRDVVTALSCSQLGIKTLRLPSMPPDQMDKAILWEVKDRMGFDVGPDQVNCLRAGPVRQGSDSREEVIVLAAPQAAVEEHLALLGEVGLQPVHIDAEPVALFRPFERFLRRRSDEPSVSVILDIGYSGARVVVARGRQIVFIKSIDTGGQKFTQAVAKQLGVSAAEAADLRLRTMRSADPKEGPAGQTDAPPADAPQDTVAWTVRDAIRPEIEMLSRELALCLRYCSVTFRGLRPEGITLTGGEAFDPAVPALLAEGLNLPCAIGEPLKGIDLSAVDLRGDRRQTLADWSLCAGLATRTATIPTALCEEDDDRRGRLSA